MALLNTFDATSYYYTFHLKIIKELKFGILLKICVLPWLQQTKVFYINTLFTI